MTRRRRTRKVVLTSARLRQGSAAAVPVARSGYALCSCCGREVRLTAVGHLRRHRDRDGIDCPNVLSGAEERVGLATLPPVVIARQNPAPRPTTPAPRRSESEPSRLDVGSSCEDCGKWLPGERRLCGRCFNHREAARR